MASVNSRNGRLYIDFRYLGLRCREQTTLSNNKANREKAYQFIERIEKEIEMGDFRYENYFPKTPRLEKIKLLEAQKESCNKGAGISFRDFSSLWLLEKAPEWRDSHKEYMDDIFRLYLNPRFGDKAINTISKSDILLFRADLLNLDKNLSISRINHIMSPLGAVLVEAADRYEFKCPWRNIKQLTVPKTKIEPFTLEEVAQILNCVRDDFKPYYAVRFFTGLRTGEIHALTWDKIDFTKKQIIVDCSLQKDGTLGETKNQSSIRTIDMSSIVFNALKQQCNYTYGKSEFVFCNQRGKPLDYKNVTNRIWYPLLEFLDLKKRKPYQTRHTTATLWLSAGESPEWIAKQLGHSTTTMLFNVYSRYVPNLTRQDGSAFDALINQETTKRL